MANATNVAWCEYINGSLDKNWATSGISYYVGYNNSVNKNRVLIMRFTLASPASSVSVPIMCYDANSTSSSKAICYGLGNDPTTDSSMTNKTGTSGALGTFYWTATYQTKTITLSNVPAGTNYLYLWTSITSAATQTPINVAQSINVTYIATTSYTLSITASTGSSITVQRTSSSFVPTGNISNGAILYNGDVLKISYSPASGYEISSATLNGSNIASGATHTVSGNVTVVITATAKQTGLVYIDNGSGFEAYQVYIDNGTSWDLYIPYIDNGSNWELCN